MTVGDICVPTYLSQKNNVRNALVRHGVGLGVAREVVLFVLCRTCGKAPGPTACAPWALENILLFAHWRVETRSAGGLGFYFSQHVDVEHPLVFPRGFFFFLVTWDRQFLSFYVDLHTSKSDHYYLCLTNCREGGPHCRARLSQSLWGLLVNACRALQLPSAHSKCSLNQFSLLLTIVCLSSVRLPAFLSLSLSLHPSVCIWPGGKPWDSCGWVRRRRVLEEQRAFLF